MPSVSLCLNCRRASASPPLMCPSCGQSRRGPEYSYSFDGACLNLKRPDDPVLWRIACQSPQEAERKSRQAVESFSRGVPPREAVHRGLASQSMLKGIPSPSSVTLLPPPTPNRRTYPFVARIDFQGIPIAVENLQGTRRFGVDANGTPWEIEMGAHYGEVWGWGTVGTDGDKLDIYVLPDETAPDAFIIDQLHPDTGEFDEQKIIVGARTQKEALELYHRQYDRPGFFGGIQRVTIERLKEMLQDKALRGKRLEKGSPSFHFAVSRSALINASLRLAQRTPDTNPASVTGR